MPRYMLTLHTTGGGGHGPSTPEEQASFMQRIEDLEADMRSSGAFVFTGGLHGPDSATVVRSDAGTMLTTDGPFAESKEQVAGFYVVEADDRDAALEWARKVVDTIGAPIEVREFFDTRTA